MSIQIKPKANFLPQRATNLNINNNNTLDKPISAVSIMIVATTRQTHEQQQ